MSKVQDESFFNIYGWMTNKLHLKGLELMVYGLIHGFTERAENHCFTGSLSYMADFTGSSKTTIQRAIKGLLNKNLISKRAVISEGVRYCIYMSLPVSLEESLENEQENLNINNNDDIVKMNTGVVKMNIGCSQNDHGGIVKMTTNKIYINDSLNDSINDKESNKELTKETIKESSKETTKEPVKKTTKNTTKSTTKGTVKKTGVKTPKRNPEPYEKPSLEQVKERIQEKQFNVNATDFFDYYEASDWCNNNGEPIKFWRRYLKTWNDNSSLYDKDKSKNKSNNKTLGSKSLWAQPEQPIDQSMIDILSSGL